MRNNVDYNLLVEAEKIRFKSDYSSAHWIYQLLSIYERGIENYIRRTAFENVIKCIIKDGCQAGIELMKTYPTYAGFPAFISLNTGLNEWRNTQTYILNDFDEHLRNRFKYVREGD